MAKETYREYMRSLLNRRIDSYKVRADYIMDLRKKYFDVDAVQFRINREFLEKHAVGIGVDVCCGDFLIGDSIGVDTRLETLGVDFNFSGDNLSFMRSNQLDYVVTNYLEALPHTLDALHEWHRALKPGGTLAMVCINANDKDYVHLPAGALTNAHRVNTFTKVTLSHYLYRAEYKDVKIEETEYKTLWVEAKK